MTNHSNEHVETKLIHSISMRDIEKKTGAVNVPIYLSSTFHQEKFGQFGPFAYARSSNPTRRALEETIAHIEGGARGFAFSSGMAAISSALMLLSAGDHIIISEDVYGGTYHFVTKLLPRYDISHTFVDMTNVDDVTEAIQPNTKAIYMETPANPLLTITDIRRIVEIAKKHDCLTFLDNTFMTPLYQNPLQLGVDVVLHSATKFLSGHSDIVAGLAVTRTKELGEQLGSIQVNFGSILGVSDSFSLIQGIKTLGSRLKQSSESAQTLAEFLSEHSFVEKVFYPGLANHSGRDVHFNQAKGAGAVLSFQLPNQRAVRTFLENMHIPIYAASLGGVESILSYPAHMSHATLPKEEREARGISDGLLRLSVGLEHIDDLITDFDQALKKAQN